CCYALQDKAWVRDPDGNEWEVFTVIADVEQKESTCCIREALSLWERVPRSGGGGQKIDPPPALRAPLSQREKDSRKSPWAQLGKVWYDGPTALTERRYNRPPQEGCFDYNSMSWLARLAPSIFSG